MIENAFGILAARWRIFRRPTIAEPNKAVTYTKAAIVSGVARGGLRGLEHPLSQTKKKEDILGIFQK